MKTKLIIIILFFISLTCCKQLPKKKLSQWTQKIKVDVANDTLQIKITNPLRCPLRISAKTIDPEIKDKLDHDFPFIMLPDRDTVFSYLTNKAKEDIKIKFGAVMGNPKDTIKKKKIHLPFKNERTYKVIQGYNGKFSHRSKYSKYALDFDLEEGDTICAAADGFVVGVIEDYVDGGNSKKWRDYANFITIFHPEMNLYTQYVHLVHKGSLVKVGDSVVSEQPIGVSGKTGFTSIEHLHFNVLKASDSGMESIPIEFEEGYIGSQLKKGDVVKN